MPDIFDLMYYDTIWIVVIAGAGLFILALIADAWWEKRRARKMRANRKR